MRTYSMMSQSNQIKKPWVIDGSYKMLSFIECWLCFMESHSFLHQSSWLKRSISLETITPFIQKMGIPTIHHSGYFYSHSF